MSSTSQGPGSGETVVIFLVVIVLLMLRRVYRSYNGMRFSASRTVAYAIFYVILGSFFSILSFFEGVSPLFAFPYAAVLLAAVAFSYRFSDRRISFWKGGDGSVYFKGGVALYLIYVVAFIARISIDVAVFGSNFLTVTAQTLTSTALYATIATDLLLMFGVGLLIGRNARVIRRYKGIEEGKEPLPDSPPSIRPLFGRKGDAPIPS
ncbi:MAG: hypothetical protein OK449_04795 [Thaumarchaeota archaeon]|nr:hypothetical protein [Nitrososphaerota archaeon]